MLYCWAVFHTLYYTYELQLRIIFIIMVTVVVSRACVCSVRSFLPPCASRPRNIGTYVFTMTQKTLIYYNRDFCWKCFVQKLRRHLLASNATNYSWATKYGYQRNPRNVGITLLFTILTKNAFVQKLQHICLPSLCAYRQYKYAYVHN